MGNPFRMPPGFDTTDRPTQPARLSCTRRWRPADNDCRAQPDNLLKPPDGCILHPMIKTRLDDQKHLAISRGSNLGVNGGGAVGSV